MIKSLVSSFSLAFLFLFLVTANILSAKRNQEKMEYTLNENQWKEKLTKEQYQILREDRTERAFGDTYEKFKKHGKGDYYCVGCDTKLFSSDAKFDSGCGWPSFFEPSHSEALIFLEDEGFGRTRTEIRCGTCNSHLGHVFKGEGFNTPTDKRYCLNGAALRFVEEK